MEILAIGMIVLGISFGIYNDTQPKHTVVTHIYKHEVQKVQKPQSEIEKEYTVNKKQVVEEHRLESGK